MNTVFNNKTPRNTCVNGLNFTSLTRHTIADYNVEPQAVVFIFLIRSCMIVLIQMNVPVIQYYC